MENKPDKSVNDFNTEKNMSSVNNTNDEVSQLSSEQFSAIPSTAKDDNTVKANQTAVPVNAQAKPPTSSTSAAAKQTAKKTKNNLYSHGNCCFDCNNLSAEQHVDVQHIDFSAGNIRSRRRTRYRFELRRYRRKPLPYIAYQSKKHFFDHKKSIF